MNNFFLGQNELYSYIYKDLNAVNNLIYILLKRGTKHVFRLDVGILSNWNNLQLQESFYLSEQWSIRLCWVIFQGKSCSSQNCWKLVWYRQFFLFIEAGVKQFYGTYLYIENYLLNTTINLFNIQIFRQLNQFYFSYTHFHFRVSLSSVSSIQLYSFLLSPTLFSLSYCVFLFNYIQLHSIPLISTLFSLSANYFHMVRLSSTLYRLFDRKWQKPLNIGQLRVNINLTGTGGGGVKYLTSWLEKVSLPNLQEQNHSAT